MKITILIIFIISNWINCLAQRYNFRTYSVEHGLAQSQVYAMCEDRRGYIWFGTAGGGVSVYDGTSFRQFTKKNGLGSNDIRTILEDHNGNLWFGSPGNGVTKYDGKTFTHFTENEGLANDNVWAIFEDHYGFIWFGTSHGITRYDPERKTGKNTRNYTTRDGLIHNIVVAILEDSKNNIWFGTYGGGVSKLLSEKESGGLTIFENYTINEGLCSNYIMSILEDRKGILWFGSDGGGISRMKKESREQGAMNKEQRDKRDVNLFTNFTINDGLSSNIVRSIMEDRNGNIWFGTSGGGVNKLVYNDNVDPPITFIHITENEGLSNNIVYSMLEDTTGNLWFGTSGGGANKLSREIFKHYTKKEGLNNNIVWSILEDHNGNLWFGTDGGGANKLTIYPDLPGANDEKKINNFTSIFTYYTKKEGLSNNIVKSIIEDRNGYIWFGTENGVTRFNPFEIPISSKSFIYITENDGLPGNRVFSILEDRNGKLWFGIWGGVVSYDPGIPVNDPRAFTYYTEREGLANSRVVTMIQDHFGNIWIGTSGGGITMLSFIDTLRLIPEFIHITKTDACPVIIEHDCIEGLNTNNVSCIVEDRLGNLWFGTEGGGINKMVLNANPAIRPSFIYITIDDGLSSNNIYLMIFDDNDNLWIGTEKGLDKLILNYDVNREKETSEIKRIIHYGKAEGFIGIETNSRAVYKDKKGNIWFGTIKGVTQYNPDADILNTLEPRTHITDLRLFFKDIEWKIYNANDTNKTQHPESSIRNSASVNQQLTGIKYDGVSKWHNLPVNLTLPYNQNHLSFTFIGICLYIPEKVRYKFMLEGLDKYWSPETSKREAVYPNLPSGEYTFKVIACNNDGVWNKQPTTYSFTITPPFWLTPWFFILCGFVALGALFGFIKIRERRLQTSKKTLEQVVKTRTKEIIKQKEEIEKQKKLVEEKNKNITDSINYAKLIQEAILPSERYIKHLLGDSFIIYKPKDIVSGDFYWIFKGTGDWVRGTKVGNQHIIIAACDCTGHGVPGAFMSIIGHDQLDQAVKQKWIIKPSEILDELNKGVRNRLSGVLTSAKSGLKYSTVMDGMDIALCSIDFDNKDLQFAGAYNPIYIIRKKHTPTSLDSGDYELIEIKGDRFPIGIFPEKESNKFTNHKIKLKKDDTIYLFSDGFVDQFGGPKNKKFMRSRFMQMLLDIQHLSMEDQQKAINKTFEQWKGDNEQVDDVLVIGLRV